MGGGPPTDGCSGKGGRGTDTKESLIREERNEAVKGGISGPTILLDHQLGGGTSTVKQHWDTNVWKPKGHVYANWCGNHNCYISRTWSEGWIHR